MCDGRIEQDAVGAQLERFADIASRSHACINDDGIIRVVFFKVFQNDPQVVGVQQSLAAANWAARGHDACRADGF